jgi:DNA-binding transcriptional ArsR family regulator
MPPDIRASADIEAIAEQVFAALADPTRRAILAALARDWDSPLGAPKEHPDRGA